MGGGGFMQHASDTNRKDRAQKAARRDKFSGNHSDKATLNDTRATKLDFSHLTPEQIAQEREEIAKRQTQRRKKNTVLFVISIAVTFALIIWLYFRIKP